MKRIEFTSALVSLVFFVTAMPARQALHKLMKHPEKSCLIAGNVGGFYRIREVSL
jgi:hypothetical protein